MITNATLEYREANNYLFRNPDAFSSIVTKYLVDMKAWKISQFCVKI